MKKIANSGIGVNIVKNATIHQASVQGVEGASTKQNEPGKMKRTELS